LVLLLGLLGMLLAAERLWNAQRAELDTDRVLLDVFEQLREGRVADAISICEREPAPVTMVLRAGLKQADEGFEAAQLAMGAAEEREMWRLETGTRTLRALVISLPLLGAGGTVLELARHLGGLKKIETGLALAQAVM